MNDERTLELAKRIEEETGKKKLNWVRSTYPNSYRLSLGIGIVVIDYNPNRDLLPDGTFLPEYSLTIYNDRSTVLDMLLADDSSDEHYTLLKHIFDLANDHYLRRDKTYGSMFDALNLPD